MSLLERQCQFSRALCRLISRAGELGYGVSLREVGRSHEQQELHIKNGLSKTMDSRHIDFLAADLVLVKDGKAIAAGEEFRPLGEFWESIGGRWGGRFGLENLPRAEQDRKLGWDSPHFEFRKEAA